MLCYIEGYNVIACARSTREHVASYIHAITELQLAELFGSPTHKSAPLFLSLFIPLSLSLSVFMAGMYHFHGWILHSAWKFSE